jgi:hypothetical protein
MSLYGHLQKDVKTRDPLKAGLFAMFRENNVAVEAHLFFERSICTVVMYIARI